MYKKTYRCIVEGQQEEMYLRHLQRLFTSFPKKTITFNTSIGNPYELGKSYENYDGVCVFDYDFDKSRFERNLSDCLKMDKTYKKRKIYHAYSSVCFDLWLVLHKEDYKKCCNKNDAYIDDVRRIYKLSPNADIKEEKVIERIMEQITLSDVKKAIERAEKIKQSKEYDTPHYVKEYRYYDNPDFSIHIFLKQVIADAKL